MGAAALSAGVLMTEYRTRRRRMRVQRSIEIEASPEQVWAYLSEPEKVLEWYIPLIRFEFTTEQKSGVGASILFEEKVQLGTVKLNCVVTEWVESEVLAFRMTSGNLMKAYEERWTVAANPSGSRFTFAEQGELPWGPIGRLIQPLAERSSGATVEKMLAKLKSLVEA
jgi:uncharacterized protein YndB with AHSA1/START domain